jgi:hypothetical protein
MMSASVALPAAGLAAAARTSSTERHGCRSSFSIFIVPIRLSHIALSSASPTVPMLETMPSLASRRVKAKDVYRVDSSGRRNISMVEVSDGDDAGAAA